MNQQRINQPAAGLDVEKEYELLPAEIREAMESISAVLSLKLDDYLDTMAGLSEADIASFLAAIHDDSSRDA